MIIKTKSFPRAALIGNPSDGYFGKTIAFVFDNFSAEVQLYETPKLEIKPEKLDIPVYESISDLVDGVKLNGYYGGVRLIKATIKTFFRYSEKENIQLHNRNFTVSYRSNIPLRLGLAGSSAIITATMKALMEFYSIQIKKPILANLILSVETVQLGISAGLQDRVAQAYEHPVFMDFDKTMMDQLGYGKYTVLDYKKLPDLYIAFRKDQSQGSEVTHNNLKARFNIREPKVLDYMKQWADITVQFKKALDEKDYSTMHDLINRNYDLREDLVEVTSANKEMVRIARSTGASAKFTGSGGAIIGIYRDEDQFEKLIQAFDNYDIEVIKPNIVHH